jgi:hypothetical protein
MCESVGKGITADREISLPNMRDVAAALAKDASENLADVDAISIGLLHGRRVIGGMQYSEPV